jgi:hypothetical protein
MGYTTHIQEVVSKQFNTLHILKMSYEYEFVCHCVDVFV